MQTNSEVSTSPGGRSRVAFALCAGLALMATPAGCSPPQVEPEHRELILMLATATSTRDAEILEAAAEEVEELRAEGRLPSAEASAFGAIIAAGRAGDWEKARRRAYALRDAQRPSQADIDRLKSRPLNPTRPLEPGARPR